MGKRKILIIKLGATGDVVRTTTLLHVLEGEIYWLTSDMNEIMLNSIPEILQIVPWRNRDVINGMKFDLTINLEDTVECAQILNKINTDKIFGAYLDERDELTYTDSSREWFDISITSRFGKEKADDLKLKNRKTYQEMIFKGLGFKFNGEKYFIPNSIATDLKGDIAIAPKSGAVWPMKNWAYFDELKLKLEKDGYIVNYLPERQTILEHIGDIQNHRYLISGDSLPMHIALGSGIKCLTIFICTSPWEIYDYGIQYKAVSSNLDQYFYKRNLIPEATTSISLNEIYSAVSRNFK